MNLNAHILYPQSTKPTALDHVAMHMDVIVVIASVLFVAALVVLS